MAFSRSIYVKKVMKLLAFIFEQPSYTKLNNKEIATVGVSDYTNQTPSKHFWKEKCQCSTPLKYNHEMCNTKGAHFQYVIKHYAKFE